MSKYLLSRNIYLACLLFLSCVILSACTSYNSISDKFARYHFLYAKKQNMLNEYSKLFDDTDKNTEQIAKMDQQIYEITKQLNDLEKDPKVKEYVLSLEEEKTNYENDNTIARNFEDNYDPIGFDTISSTSESQDFDTLEFNFTDLSYETQEEKLSTDFDDNKNDSDYIETTDEYENNTVDIPDSIDTSATETDSEDTFENVVNEDDYKETI